MQPHRKQAAERLIRHRPRSLLDLGAGFGEYTSFFLDHGVRVTAIDLKRRPEFARRVGDCPSLTFVTADINRRLPLGDESFDAVWFSHCLEHTDNPMAVLDELWRVLRPQGTLAVVVPPFRTRVVGRHLFTGWSTGQLMLVLFKCGFRIKDGSFARFTDDVVAIVKKDRRIAWPSNDEVLIEHGEAFPPAIARQIRANSRGNGEHRFSFFEGGVSRINWGPTNE